MQTEILTKEGFLKQFGSFEAFFKKYFPFLCSYVDMFVADRQIAEDIVADIFKSIWENRHSPKLAAISDLKAYIYRSAKNKVRTYHRNLQTRGRHFDIIRNTPDHQVVTDNAYTKFTKEESYNNLIKLIKLELKKLPKKCEFIIRLRYFHNVPINEVAAYLGIKESTVRSKTATSIKQIKKNLSHPHLREQFKYSH